MPQIDYDTLAKAPVLVHLAIACAKPEITDTDRQRFMGLVAEAAGPNARVCAYTDTLNHLRANWRRLYDEVYQNTDTRPLLMAIRPLLMELPQDESMRFRAQLARVAMAATRDDAGHPSAAAVEVAQTLAPALGMPGYDRLSKRFTDDLVILDYWPGSDPALQRFSEEELRQLAAVFGTLHATLGGSHGSPRPEHDEAVKHWLLAGYASENQNCCVHALIRYLDQLFMLVQVEVQYTQSSRPVFEQGYALMKEKLSDEEQTVFLQFFDSLGAVFMTPGAPPMVSEMLTKITAIMHGEPVPEEDSELTEEEWDVLSLGLVATFVLVATADGKVGDKEIKAFADIIEVLTGAADLGPAVQAAARISDNFDKLLPIVLSGTVPRPQYVFDALELIALRLSTQDLQAYKQIATTIAEKTAEAEGGFLGLGSKISADERKVLDGLKELLAMV